MPRPSSALPEPIRSSLGTPGTVQALRPYSGGNPLVEADILTGDGLFRLTKQFYGGRRAMVREIGLELPKF